ARHGVLDRGVSRQPDPPQPLVAVEIHLAPVLGDELGKVLQHVLVYVSLEDRLHHGLACLSVLESKLGPLYGARIPRRAAKRSIGAVRSAMWRGCLSTNA